METNERYLRRKKEELDLIAACLSRPPAVPRPRSLEGAIEQKFRLAAAVKAERTFGDWTATETSWSGPEWRRAGRFAWRYEYQRADLVVHGPAIYRALADRPGLMAETIYSACGMSALATLLLPLGRAAPAISLVVPHGAYNETLQLVETYAACIKIDRLAAREAARPDRNDRLRVLLVDSSVTEKLLPRDLAKRAGRWDLLIFDTTCLSSASARIRTVLTWADQAGVPVVLVRSHAKLDSLGAEYGRLGSAVFVASARADARASRLLAQLAHETREAVRLLGAAPVPGNLPPFAGGARYAALSAQRTANLIRNGRRMVRRLRAAGVPVTSYQHGLYALLQPAQSWELEHAKHVAAQLAADLRHNALPVRHAGSFGFDFCVLDGFPDPGGERFVVRLAFPDLPTQIADELAGAIAKWWRGHVTGRDSTNALWAA
jgi:hypothetical protein